MAQLARADQQTLDARRHLFGVHRLGYIFIRARLQALNLGCHLCSPAQENNRQVDQIHLLAHPAAHIDPVHIGQNNVENDQIRLLALHLLQRLLAGHCSDNHKTLLLKRMAH